MQFIELFCSLFSAAIQKWLQRVVWPADEEGQLPPIRCVGDPAEIYLA